MNSLLALLVLVQDVDAVVIERTADLRIWNTLGEERRVRTTQVLTIAGDALRIEDVTYGEVVVIRGDTIAKFDPYLKIAYEATIKDVAAKQAAALDEIRAAREQVPHTEDEKLLTQTLLRFNRYDGDIKAAVRATGQSGEVAGHKVAEQAVEVESIQGKQALATVKVDAIEGGNYYAPLARAGAFHPTVAGIVDKLGGAPLSGRERYVLLGESYLVEFEATSVARKKVDAKTFEAPDGFAKAAGPDLKKP